MQQPIRKRHRPQDVFDIAFVVRVRGAGLDRGKVADFLLRKAKIRDVYVSRSAFDEELRQWSYANYDKDIRSQTGEHFIPFDEAWSELVRFVASLDIPA